MQPDIKPQLSALLSWTPRLQPLRESGPQTGPVKRRALEQRRQALDLLCRSGAGLVSIAPSVCQLAREMVGAEAGALFWLDERGIPLGFFHEDSPEQAKDLFLNAFEELFLGPHELNVAYLANLVHPNPVGNLLAPPASYFRSNTFNLLVRASGHHHTLDMCVQIAGRTRAVLLLFRQEGLPYANADARLLELLLPYLRRAVEAPEEGADWSTPAVYSGQMLVAQAPPTPAVLGAPAVQTTWQVRLVTGEVHALLHASKLVGQSQPGQAGNLPVPLFVQAACSAMVQDGAATAQRSLHVPGGQLCATLARMQSVCQPADQPDVQVLVTLELRAPPRLMVVQRVLDLPLSPLQREIALLAGSGGRRGDCESAIGVSQEALKKHLRAIYRVAGVADWDELGRVLA